MEIREIHPAEIESARRLLAERGWSHRVSRPDDFRELVRRSQRALVAMEDAEVVGLLRGAMSFAVAFALPACWRLLRIRSIARLLRRCP